MTTPSGTREHRPGIKMIFCALQAVDGLVNIEIWDGRPRDVQPHVLFAGAFEVVSGSLALHDPNEDFVVIVRPHARTCAVEIMVDEPTFPGLIQIVISPSAGSEPAVENR